MQAILVAEDERPIADLIRLTLDRRGVHLRCRA